MSFLLKMCPSPFIFASSLRGSVVVVKLRGVEVKNPQLRGFVSNQKNYRRGKSQDHR